MKTCLYSSFSNAPGIANYVKDYLLKLQPFNDRIILITNERQFNTEDKSFLSSRKIDLITVKNEGHDFGMWYKGLKELKPENISELTLANDSCIPVSEFDFFYEWFRKSDLDYGSLSDSYQRDYYLQSYFLIAKSTAIQHIYDYFASNKLQKNFADVVRVYEFGLTRHLITKGCKTGAYFSAKKYNSADISIDCAKELIADGFPLIKKKLITKKFRHYQRFRLENIGFNFDEDYKSFLKSTVANADYLLDGIHGNKDLSNNPLVSIICSSALQSAQEQTYDNLEVLSSEYSFSDSLKNAKGEYVFIIGNDTLMQADTVHKFLLNALETDADLSYSDEIKIDRQGKVLGFHLKPGYNPDLLMSFNYIGESYLFKQDLLQHNLTDPSNSVDLLIELCAKSDRISHIAEPLLKTKVFNGNSYLDYDSQNYDFFDKSLKQHNEFKKSVSSWCESLKTEPEILDGPYPGIIRLKRKIIDCPLVSIIIHSVSSQEILERCISSIRKNTHYKNYEIIIESEKEVSETTSFESLEKCIHSVKGEHILFLDSATEIISEGWLSSMLEHSQINQNGLVGAKLYYPNEIISETYSVINLFGFTGDPNKFMSRHKKGYFYNPHLIQNVSVVSPSCFMIKKKLLDNIEEKSKVLHIDWSLQALERGFKNIFTPYSELYTYKRINDETPVPEVQKERLKNNFQKYFKTHDSFYNSAFNHNSPYNPHGWSYKYCAPTGSRELLSAGIKNLYTKIGRINSLKLALFGAGQHTQRLLSTTNLSPHTIECIIDEKPKVDLISNIPVISSEYIKEIEVDAIIISSDTIEEKLINRLLELEVRNVRVITVYSDIILEI